MDYIRKEADGQLAFTQSTDFLKIPSSFMAFIMKQPLLKPQNLVEQCFVSKVLLMHLKKSALLMRFQDARE
mgnify:CR=1 FL=1